MPLSVIYCCVRNHLFSLRCLLNKLPQDIVTEKNDWVYFTHRPAVCSELCWAGLSLCFILSVWSAQLQSWGLASFELLRSCVWGSMLEISWDLSLTLIHTTYTSPCGPGFLTMGSILCHSARRRGQPAVSTTEARPSEFESTKGKCHLETGHVNTLIIQFTHWLATEKMHPWEIDVN